MTILDKIIDLKKIEVAQRQQKMPVSLLEKEPFFTRRVLSLVKSIRDNAKSGIIAEFKRKSPSKGVINDQAAVVAVTEAYTNHGACGLSVLTDEHFFGGSSQDLKDARKNQVPILRKDFMISEYQLVEARAMGADVILLIAACLTPTEVRNLAKTAKSLGLEVLLELHAKAELGHLCEDVDVIGINNRDLKTFRVDLERSIAMADMIGSARPLISESGISAVETILQLKAAGFSGFLMGENFMKSMDPGQAFAEFVSRLKNSSVNTGSIS